MRRTATLLALLTLLAAHPASAQLTVPGSPEAGAFFGYALAYGDFDGDGDADLAMGAPNTAGADGDGVGGSVTVVYLSADGRAATGTARFVQGQDGVPGVDEADDFFGSDLATGDFDGDGFEDLAIGAPFEDIGSEVNAGAVFVLYGSAAGLTTAGAYSTAQDRPDIAGAPEAGDGFGWSVAAGDLDGDGTDDLAVGVPFEDLGTVADAGAVLVLYGASSGLADVRSELVTPPAVPDRNFGQALATYRPTPGGAAHLVVGAPAFGALGSVAVYAHAGSALTVASEVTASAPGTAFGAALAGGDFDGDGAEEFAVGTPFEAVDGVGASGRVYVYPAAQAFDQTMLAPLAANEAGDDFGAALAAADLDGDGRDDLAIGARSEDIGSVVNAGAAFALYGSDSGLTAVGAFVTAQDRPGVPGTPEAADVFGFALAASAGRLGVGIPGESIGDVEDAGAVLALVGTAGGVTADGAFLIHPGIDLPVSTGAAGGPGGADALALSAPAPNPASGAATLRLALGAPADVSAAVFDVLGRQVAALHDGPLGAGEHALRVATGALPPGVYLVRVTADGEARTRSLTVAR